MTTHTCPICHSHLYVNGALCAWITADGRVILETLTVKPTDQRWLELPASAQNWLAELLRIAQETAIERRAQA